MKFGLNQYGKPTPQRMELLFDLLTTLTSILAGFFTAASFISHNVSDIVTSILTLLIVPSLQALKRFFGADITDKKVSIQDVKVIDDSKI